MHQSSSEIVVLKPTTVFLSFLSSQIPSLVDVPNLKLLQTDCTAYVINKYHSDEGTLDEIEKYFSTMFRHEISRWLGKEVSNEIENSFLDFLCCFKFELHPHIILMEQTMAIGKQVLTIKPRSVLLNWIKSAAEGQEELENVRERVTLSHLTESATVIVKNFSDLNEISIFLKRYYDPIFESVMTRISPESSQWPAVNSFESFCRYFSIEIHTQLVHLTD